MKRKFGLSILLAITMISCAPFSNKVKFNDQVELRKETTNKLNGTYEVGGLRAVWKYENSKPVFFENDSTRFLLFETLKETNHEIRENISKNIKNYTVEVDVQNENIISFYLVENELKIDSVTLKYKVRKDGYIYLKNRNFRTQWVPGLWGNFEVDRSKIGINKSGNLLITTSYFLYGAVLVIIGDTKRSNYSSEYKRKT